MPRPNDSHALPGSERPLIGGSKSLGPVEAGERLTVAVILRQKPGGAPVPDLDHWQETAPEQRTYLAAEQFYERHGAAAEETEAVAKYLTGRALQVLEQHAGRRRILVQGTAAQMNATFGVTLNRYRTPERAAPRAPRQESDGRPFGAHVETAAHEHRGFEGPVHLSAGIADLVEAVIGLDDRRLGRPAAAGTGDPPGAVQLLPTTIARDYNFPTNSAAGQTIGIFEDASGGAAYLASDIDLFLGGLPKPSLKDILLLGYTNDPLNVGSNGGFECNIDVSIAAAAARGVNINVYFTDDSELGWDTFFDRALFPLPGDRAPSVLTASWVPHLSDDTGTIGNYTNPASTAHNFHRHLRNAAARGVTVFMAIGDWGSANLITDGKCHVSYPNGDPFVTSCGGTILGTTDPLPPPARSEYTWSDAHLPSSFDSPPYDATGGGVSDQFPRPPYQVAAGVLPISKNDGGIRRGVPDVAGMVAMTGFFIKGGGPTWGFGTSAVAPLYAGLTATVNAFLGRNSGFLNPTLYRYGPRICNDIQIGNNDSGNAPDAPFYTAAVGWDACTGWGSINGRRFLAALAPAPIVATLIEDQGDFGDVCVGRSVNRRLTINNTGFATLLIARITSSQAEFLIPNVAFYPLAVAPGESIEVDIRFKPGVSGFAAAVVEIFSNDLFSPTKLTVSGSGVTPRLVLAMPASGMFGDVCRGSFRDEPLVLNNAGPCPLFIRDITATPAQFIVPEVLAYPIMVAGGACVELPIRFQPTAIGPVAGTITVDSNDPRGPQTVRVSGHAPAGKLAITGSNCFGAVPACCSEERTIWLCNVGDCKLFVSSVTFKRPNRHWRLINSPFPATLHPGSCLALVIRYEASERYPRSCELRIDSDDPSEPVKLIELLAATIWAAGGCDQCCERCRGGHCDTRHCDPCHCRTCGGERETERDAADH